MGQASETQMEWYPPLSTRERATFAAAWQHLISSDTDPSSSPSTADSRPPAAGICTSKFRRFLGRLRNVVEDSAVQQMVMLASQRKASEPPSAAVHAQQEELVDQDTFIAACYLVVRWVQGYRNLPERFPRRFYEGQPPQLVFSSDVGSINSPIPYYHFSCMFRPLLERKYQEGTSIWAKCALVATMWVSEESSLNDSPSSSRGIRATVIEDNVVESRCKVLNRFRTCNIETPYMEMWSVKAADFALNYRMMLDDAGEEVAIPPHLLQSGTPRALEEHLRKRLSQDELSRISKLSYAKLQQVLKGEMDTLRCHEPWQLAQGQGIVVAVELTPQLIEQAFRAQGCPCDCSTLYVGAELHRQETYCPSYCFKSGDFLVGDLVEVPPAPGPPPAGVEGVGRGEVGQGAEEAAEVAAAMVLQLTGKLMWKPGNKSTLITRTVARKSFLATYRPVAPYDQLGRQGSTDSSGSMDSSGFMDRDPSV